MYKNTIYFVCAPFRFDLEPSYRGLPEVLNSVFYHFKSGFQIYFVYGDSPNHDIRVSVWFYLR